MLTDHCSFLLYMQGSLGLKAYYLLRGIGRLAFPIYCFMLVEGLRHSSDREKYVLRLMLLALISQLPFTLLFSPDNYLNPIWGPPQLLLTGWEYLLTALFALILSMKRKAPAGKCLILTLFIILPGLRLSAGGFVLLDGHMNVFYTLALGLMLMSLIAAAEKKAIRPGEGFALVLLTAAVLIIIAPVSDYALSGLMLILMLYFARVKKPLQLIGLIVWSLLQYGLQGGGLVFTLFSSLAALPLLFYNGKRGPGLKLFFYGFYPLHLSLLAIISICT